MPPRTNVPPQARARSPFVPWKGEGCAWASSPRIWANTRSRSSWSRSSINLIAAGSISPFSPLSSGRRLAPLRIHNLGDNCIPLIDLTDDQAVALIQSEQIDVLVDASGHTMWDRLGIFARRAAPVQVSHIGYWSTTGLTEMDWVFADPGCDPCYDAHFTEGLWRLPRLTVSYNGDRSLPESGWKPDPDGTIWLGSFNRYSKIRKQTLALWAGVLHALPEAKLLFEDGAMHEEETHQRILTVLAGHGIEAGRVAIHSLHPRT